MDRLHLDLSIVKREPNTDDYGQSNGNILDNIISEDDFHHQFGGAAQTNSTVPNTDEMDVSVDWLSSFFDEPQVHNYSLNPSLAVVDSPVMAGIKSGSFIEDGNSHGNGTNGFHMCTDDITDELAFRGQDTMKASVKNPFLSQLEASNALADPLSNVLDNPGKMNSNFNRAIHGRTQFLLKAAKPLNQLRRELIEASSLKTATKLDPTGNVLLSRENSNDQLDTELLTTDIFSATIKTEAETTTDCSDSGHHANQIHSNFNMSFDRNNLIKHRSNSYDSNSRSPDCVSPSSEGHSDIALSGDFSPTERDPYQDDHQPHERSPFYLTDEERRTLITEGLPVPKGLPLSKIEERALKKVRRKIKNKISAQESRRKKKEYMESLEKKIDGCNSENLELRKNMDKLETTNRSLLLQLQKLQQYVATRVSRSLATAETQTPMESEAIMIA